MRHITAGFRGKYEQTHGFEQFARTLPSLKSLSLVFPDGWVHDVHVYWSNRHYVGLFDHRKIVTRELTISDCLPQTFTSAMAYMFDLSTVTKLALFDCNFWLLQDLHTSPDLRNLTHFEFHTWDSVDEAEVENLTKLFKRNQSLRHLCLHLFSLWSIPLEPQLIEQGVSPSVSPLYSTPYLWPLSHNLKTLSLFDRLNLEEHHFPSEASLKYICNEFSTLEQLGLRAPELKCRASQANKRHEFVLRYLVSANCPLLLPAIEAYTTYDSNRSDCSRT
jgi:hypothetical protein